ncbi:hypothetical protein MMC27_008307 [Xylographa pallens]|nr:hypothetical protein [Xylographa pallens]
MDYDDSEMRDILMSATNIKFEPEWDTLSGLQDFIPIDAPGIMKLQSSQATYPDDWDAILRTFLPAQEPSALEGKHPDCTGASLAEQHQYQFVELEQAVARANDERKELEVQVAQHAAKAKLLEDMLLRLKDNKHDDTIEHDAVDSDLKTSNVCSHSDHVGDGEPCQSSGALPSPQQRSYVKVSPFWLGQNLELDEDGCLWWEMS